MINGNQLDFPAANYPAFLRGFPAENRGISPVNKFNFELNVMT